MKKTKVSLEKKAEENIKGLSSSQRINLLLSDIMMSGRITGTLKDWQEKDKTGHGTHRHG